MVKKPGVPASLRSVAEILEDIGVEHLARLPHVILQVLPAGLVRQVPYKDPPSRSTYTP